MTAFLLALDFPRLFVSSAAAQNWREIAMNWFWAGVFTGLVNVVFHVAIKAGSKWLATSVQEKAWTRTRTWVFLLLGIIPIWSALGFIWLFTRDFYNHVKFGNYFNSMLVGFIVFLTAMVLVHLFFWRREII